MIKYANGKEIVQGVCTEWQIAAMGLVMKNASLNKEAKHISKVIKNINPM